MTKDPIISVSGLRGIVGESLTPEIVVRYVAAYLSQLPPGAIVVSRDGRATGPVITDVVKAAVAMSGRTCLDANVASTPTVGVLVKSHAASGGIQVTASHNPPPYNGLKLFSAEGRVLPAEEGEKVLAAWNSNSTAWATHDKLGSIDELADPLSAHCQAVLRLVDTELITSRKFKVLIDANHGSGGALSKKLLESLGCETILHGGSPDGLFEHPPEPVAENLQNVAAEVRHQGADIGFCQDPDADRIAIIDEQGRYVGEEATLALCVDHILAKQMGPIVTNCSTSKMSEVLAERHGAPFFRSKVGEANVVDMMNAQGALLGGEGNGGVIEPQVGGVRDSFVAMAYVLESMARRQKPIGTLVDALPRFSIVKEKIPLDGSDFGEVMQVLEAAFPEAKPDRLDGLRLDWSNRWVLIRPSNTEPIVRIIAEAPSTEQAADLCKQAIRALAPQ